MMSIGYSLWQMFYARIGDLVRRQAPKHTRIRLVEMIKRLIFSQGLTFSEKPRRLSRACFSQDVN